MTIAIATGKSDESWELKEASRAGPLRTNVRQTPQIKGVSQILGYAPFSILRQENQNLGLRMIKMPELVLLTYDALYFPHYPQSREIIGKLKTSWLAGNTAIYPLCQGIFVQDEPRFENVRMVMDEVRHEESPKNKEKKLKKLERLLETKLGKYQDRGVVYSDDRSLRFTPYGFKVGEQTASEIERSSGVIAVSGDGENAEKLARMSEKFENLPSFCLGYDLDQPKIRIADLNAHFSERRLNIGADGDEYSQVRYSFGVPIAV